MSEPHRVRVEDTNKRIRVRVNGDVVADTTRARILYEAGLRPRYYLPREHILMEALTEVAGKHTTCPLKGVADYYSASGADSIAWTYPRTKDDPHGIEGYLCFYTERPEVELEVDGATQ